METYLTILFALALAGLISSVFFLYKILTSKK